MRIAVSVAQNYTLENKHFGDGDMFVVFELNENNQFQKITEIENQRKHNDDHNHDHDHGEENKAQGIGQTLKKYNVDVLLARQYGANVLRMLKKFTVLKANNSDLNAQLNLLLENIDSIKKDIDTPQGRKMIKL